MSDTSRPEDPRSRPRPASKRPPATVVPEQPLPESAAWNITATMMSGLLGFGVPAFLAGSWLDQEWLTGVGLVVGMALALTIVWFRYGTYRP